MIKSNTRIPLKELVLLSNTGDILREMNSNGNLSRFYPELKELDVNSKHHKNNFEHSIKVLENAKELARENSEIDVNDYVLFIAALYHDVGKPATFKFEGKKATFRNHETVGANMMRRILKNEGLTNKEISEIRVLIANHMRGHTFAEGWTDSAIRRLANEAGSITQVHRIGIIFGSDATTKYEKKRNAFRKNANQLRDAMLKILEDDEKAKRRPAIDGHRVMEVLEISPGKKLGEIMKFLNTEDGLKLNKDEAEEVIKTML